MVSLALGEALQVQTPARRRSGHDAPRRRGDRGGRPGVARGPPVRRPAPLHRPRSTWSRLTGRRAGGVRPSPSRPAVLEADLRFARRSRSWSAVRPPLGAPPAAPDRDPRRRIARSWWSSGGAIVPWADALASALGRAARTPTRARPGRKRPSRPRPPTPRARLPTAAPTVAPTVDDARSAAPTDDGGDRAPARRHDAAAEGDPPPRARLGGPHGAEHRRRHHRRADRHRRGRRHLRSPVSYRELTQHYPRRAGWSTTPARSGDATAATLADVAGRVTSEGGRIAAIGITTSARRPSRGNRSTGARCTGRSLWQDRRTADRCAELERSGHEPMVRAPHRSGARPVLLGHKFAWMLSEGGVADRRTWRSAPSTRGSSGASPAGPAPACTRPTRPRQPHLTPRHRHARLVRRGWPELFGVPLRALPEGTAHQRALRRDRPALRGRPPGCR